jgi:hypothetical protein
LRRCANRASAFIGNHLDCAPGKSQLAIDDQHMGPGARQQNAGCSAIADPILGRTATRDAGRQSLLRSPE